MQDQGPEQAEGRLGESDACLISGSSCSSSSCLYACSASPRAAAAPVRTEGMLSSRCAVQSLHSSGSAALHCSGKLAAHLPEARSAASLTYTQPALLGMALAVAVCLQRSANLP